MDQVYKPDHIGDQIMEAKELTNINVIAQEVRARIAKQRYVTPDESMLFHCTTKLAIAKHHKLALLLSNYSRSTDKFAVNTSNLFKDLKLTTLKNKTAKLDKQFQLVLDNFSVHVNLTDDTNQRCFYTRDLVSAYIFYSIAQGDFLTNLKSMSATDFRKEPIIKVPNPFIRSYHIEHLTTELQNILIGTVFSLVAYILEITEQVPEPIKVPKKRDLKPLRKTIHGKHYSNCKTDAKANEYALGMVEISEITYLKHKNIFKEVVGYEGKDTNDWQYFRYMKGTLNAGMFEDRYAISPSLGIKRSLNTQEFYNVGVIGKI